MKLHYKEILSVDPINRSNKYRFMYSYEHTLSHLCQHLKPKDVLEWGPGHSTEVIRIGSPESNILSIEHDEKYFVEMKERFKDDPNVTIFHKIISSVSGSTGYVITPILQNIIQYGDVTPCYDLIFVDGRLRLDCLVIARQLIRDNGVVVLHDFRSIYKKAIGTYPYICKFPKQRTTYMSKSPLTYFDNM